MRWNEDQETAYFGNNLRVVTTPSTPNDLINTDNGRFKFSMWTMKVNGSYDAGWGIRLTPALRFQQGQPFGAPLKNLWIFDRKCSAVNSLPSMSKV